MKKINNCLLKATKQIKTNSHHVNKRHHCDMASHNRIIRKLEAPFVVKTVSLTTLFENIWNICI